MKEITPLKSALGFNRSPSGTEGHMSFIKAHVLLMCAKCSLIKTVGQGHGLAAGRATECCACAWGSQGVGFRRGRFLRQDGLLLQLFDTGQSSLSMVLLV